MRRVLIFSLLQLLWLYSSNSLAAFLSYLRLSIYMSVVSIAIIISFHFKNDPTPLELRLALPLGIVFWVLAIACLALGFGNYVKTMTKYSRRMALVQTGWKTQIVRPCTRVLPKIMLRTSSLFSLSHVY
jgi:hypothetical protein